MIGCNVTYSIKPFEWSVRLEGHYINMRTYCNITLSIDHYVCIKVFSSEVELMLELVTYILWKNKGYSFC